MTTTSDTIQDERRHRRAIRRYRATASMAATAGIGEHPLVFVDHAIGLLRVVITVAVWRAVLAGDATAAGSADQVLTYVVLAAVLYDQLDARTTIVTSIWEGTIASRLLRPVSIFGDHMAEMVGGWLLRWVTFSAPALVVAALLGVSPLPASPARAAAFVVSLLLSVAVATAVDFLFGLVVIHMSENLWSLLMARNSITPLLAGAVIPLPLLPWGIGGVLQWLPFASMAAAPLRIYTGDGDVLTLLAVQAGWAAVLWTATRVGWRRSAPRMVSFNG